MPGMKFTDDGGMEMDFNGNLYVGEDGEFYLTFFTAINMSAGSTNAIGNPGPSEMIIYYKVSDKSKIMAMDILEFVTKFKYHDPYPNLRETYAEKLGTKFPMKPKEEDE